MDACVGFLFVTVKKRPHRLVGVQVGLFPCSVVFLSYTYVYMHNEREREKKKKMYVYRERMNMYAFDEGWI